MSLSEDNILEPFSPEYTAAIWQHLNKRFKSFQIIHRDMGVKDFPPIPRGSWQCRKCNEGIEHIHEEWTKEQYTEYNKNVCRFLLKWRDSLFS